MKMKILNKIRKATTLKSLLVLIMISWIPVLLNGQSEKKHVREGNHEYEKNKYQDAEISYRKAIDKNKVYPDAVFNIGDALYKQKKFDEAGKQFTENYSMNDNKGKKASAYYNLGNSLLQANKVKESIDAYKNSLKLKPGNKEAKYNLAYAQDLLKLQQQQQQQNKDNNKDKDKKDQNKDQKKNDKKDQDKQNPQNNNPDNQKQQQQQQEQGISKENAERLLNSIANDEKNVQEKVKLAKASKEKVRTVKNW